MSELGIDPDFDYEGFAQRLADAIAPEKITAFSTRTGTPQPTLTKYLKGQGVGPRLDIVTRIARGAGVSIDWLVWGKGDGPEAAADIIRVPRYDAQLAAGYGRWNEGRRMLDYIPFTADFFRKRLGRTSAKGLAMLEGRGDSMEPTIRDRALLMIDEEDTRITDGIFAFVLDGDARVKRMRRLTDGLQLISDNDSYPVETLSLEEASKIQVIGRLLYVGQVLSRAA